MVYRQHVSPHPWTSLALLTSSQTPASGCSPRRNTRSCTGLNVSHLPVHVKQRKPFLFSYCSRLDVVETQSAGCGLPRVLLLTFFVLIRAERSFEICGDIHSRAFQGFVTMIPNCSGFCSLLQPWTADPPRALLLVDVAAEMTLPSHRWLLSKVTQRVRIVWISLISSLHQWLPGSGQVFPWKVEWGGDVCSLFSDRTCFHPRVPQSCGATLAALPVFSAETPECHLTVEPELLLQSLRCVYRQEINDHWCSFVAQFCG